MTPAQIGRLIAASRTRPDGLVPVFGSGLNIQASRMHDDRLADDWASLLDGIAAEVGLTKAQRNRLPHSLLSRWEHLVARGAETYSIEPFAAEAQLQKRVIEDLRERQATADRYVLYKELAASQQPDMISLNFDRRLALSLGRERFDAGPRRPPEGPSGASLYRHSKLSARPDGPITRVWYPHGDTKRVDTVKLGIRRYGFHLGLLREHLGLQDPLWRITVPWEESASVLDALEDPGKTSWVDIFMTRPLLFVGCGLGQDEWSLWWLLRVRSERSTVPPAYFAHVDRCDDAVAALGPVVGLQPVRFKTYDHLWGIVRSALA